MKKIIAFLLIIISIILSGCTTQNIIENDNKDVKNNNKNINIDLSLNPNYCQTNDDCVAIPNPANPCYSGCFNKNALKAIEEFKNERKMMKQDCPKFSKVYCKNNKCIVDRK